MKLATILPSLALGSALAAGGVFLSPSFAGDQRPAAAHERAWLSIAQIHEKLQAAGYRNIEKIEREHGGYEARATDRNGERIKLYLNPQTGDILDQRAGRRARDGGEQRQRNSADCNQRRCRDDLPQNPAAPARAPAAK